MKKVRKRKLYRSQQRGGAAVSVESRSVPTGRTPLYRGNRSLLYISHTKPDTGKPVGAERKVSSNGRVC